MKPFFYLMAALLLFPVAAHAAVKTQTVSYQQGGVELEGYLAYDDATQDKRPGVLVAHEWKGLSDYEKKSAEKLAELGYVALAVDIYGKDVRPQTNEEAGAEAGKYKNNRALARQRMLAGLETLKANPLVDSGKIGVMGYCFGGMAALELGRSGADVKAIVIFHGNLSNPTPEDARNIKAKVLVLHGADDPFVPVEEVAAFEDEMKKANVSYWIIRYGGAVHAFSNPASGNDPSKGAAYNQPAAEKSWLEMEKFFKSTLK